MIFFWIAYFLLSFLISFLISLLVKNRFFKIFLFSFFLATSVTVWFKAPGENSLSPIFSIFMLEATILDDNGLLRLLRPFGIVFTLTFFFSYFIWKKDTKS